MVSCKWLCFVKLGAEFICPKSGKEFPGAIQGFGIGTLNPIANYCQPNCVQNIMPIPSIKITNVLKKNDLWSESREYIGSSDNVSSFEFDFK